MKWLAKLRCLLYWAVTFAWVIYITELQFTVLKRSWSMFILSLMCMKMHSFSHFQSALPRSVTDWRFSLPFVSIRPMKLWNLSGLYLGSTWTFCAHSHLLQAQPGIVPNMRPWSPSSRFFPVHYTWSSSCFILLCSLLLSTLQLPSPFCSIILQVPS